MRPRHRPSAALSAADDDGFDDISGRFDDIRYAPVAVNPLIPNKTRPVQM
jgi:hypothetical protein